MSDMSKNVKECQKSQSVKKKLNNNENRLKKTCICEKETDIIFTMTM